jgi:hypothetical protein
MTHELDRVIQEAPSQKQFSRGGQTQRVARAGEYFVVAELNKRGAYAVTFAGNMPKIDIMACSHDQSRTIHIQVKTKRGGRSWHSTIIGSRPTSSPDDSLAETLFWIFVDLGKEDSPPRYWIVPDWWIRNDIYRAHQSYLKRHGGQRARNPQSTHHAIEEIRLAAWRNRWEILGLFEVT